MFWFQTNLSNVSLTSYIFLSLFMIITFALFSFHSMICFLCVFFLELVPWQPRLCDVDNEFTAALVPLDLSMGSRAYMVKSRIFIRSSYRRTYRYTDSFWAAAISTGSEISRTRRTASRRRSSRRSSRRALC